MLDLFGEVQHVGEGGEGGAEHETHAVGVGLGQVEGGLVEGVSDGGEGEEGGTVAAEVGDAFGVGGQGGVGDSPHAVVIGGWLLLGEGGQDGGGLVDTPGAGEAHAGDDGGIVGVWRGRSHCFGTVQGRLRVRSGPLRAAPVRVRRSPGVVFKRA